MSTFPDEITWLLNNLALKIIRGSESERVKLPWIKIVKIVDFRKYIYRRFNNVRESEVEDEESVEDKVGVVAILVLKESL
ncbi:5321_t:CDS:2 [Entrophospora sp. SA101]|nr:5321_t:CDS:2 [Entrophospora sp. SA101]CAJ0827775.1 2434_t:CDS:2 [Entrophospora sp. SA101]